jgi:hypothetical protein
MILTEVLFVSPETPRVLMLDRFKDEDPEVLAQGYAKTFPDIIYFLADLVITGGKEDEEPWPEISWTNWYGKMVTSNTYAYYHADGRGLIEIARLTEGELKWWLNTQKSAILFVIEEDHRG